jgi:23S rRNA (guanine745-N1)-methyltransferase
MSASAGPGGRAALLGALPALRCPVCTGGLTLAGDELCCERGHRFDIARQGYVNLAGGGRPAANADTATMVSARTRFLDRGHYAPIAAALGEFAARHGSRPAGPAVIVDLAGGTGYYLAAVLDAAPDRAGICLDVSRAALRRAAAAHPRAAAVGADVWRGLPLADDCAAVVLSAFGPRNAAETIRVLGPGGVFVLLTPTAAHLAEIVGPLGMLSVDAAKADRLRASLSDLDQVDAAQLAYPRSLAHADLMDLVGMGPSAHHVDPDELARRVAGLPDSLTVTVSVTLSAYQRPRPR